MTPAEWPVAYRRFDADGVPLELTPQPIAAFGFPCAGLHAVWNGRLQCGAYNRIELTLANGQVVRVFKKRQRPYQPPYRYPAGMPFFDPELAAEVTETGRAYLRQLLEQGVLGDFKTFRRPRDICLTEGHNVKDKGWGIRSCRRCGTRL